MASKSTIGTAIQQVCTGLDLSRCKRPTTIQESIGNAYHNLYTLRYFYASVWVILSLLTMPIKLHLIHVILVLLLGQITYSLENKPIGDHPAHILHILVGACTLYGVLLVLFEETDTLAMHLILYLITVYVHSTTFPANSSDHPSTVTEYVASPATATTTTKHVGSGLMGTVMV